MFQAAVAAVVKQQGARLGVEPDHAEQKGEIADARGDKRFFRRRRRARFVIPKTNEQIRGQPHQFPADKQQQQIIRNDHAQHRGGKQRQETEEAREILVLRHVAKAVDEYEQPDQRHHHEHDGSERIEHPAQPEPLVAELEPFEVGYLPRGFSLPGMV